MLVPAYYHKDRLIAAYSTVVMESSHFWWSASSYRNFTIEIKDSQWSDEQWVSLDAEDNIAGYFSADIDRDARRVAGISVARLGGSPVFSIDLVRFLRGLRRYRSVSWWVAVGNPAEKHYDAICARCGGRVVGTFRKAIRLTDGKLYDKKWYEIENPTYAGEYET
jgi:hypothetical protein